MFTYLRFTFLSGRGPKPFKGFLFQPCVASVHVSRVESLHKIGPYRAFRLQVAMEAWHVSSTKSANAEPCVALRIYEVVIQWI